MTYEEENVALRAALKPFAVMVFKDCVAGERGVQVSVLDIASVDLCVNDFRHARSFFVKEEPVADVGAIACGLKETFLP